MGTNGKQYHPFVLAANAHQVQQKQLFADTAVKRSNLLMMPIMRYRRQVWSAFAMRPSGPAIVFAGIE